jgi:hypothetical protein
MSLMTYCISKYVQKMVKYQVICRHLFIYVSVFTKYVLSHLINLYFYQIKIM